MASAVADREPPPRAIYAERGARLLCISAARAIMMPAASSPLGATAIAAFERDGVVTVESVQ
eukprot:COSAG01_NODE_32308_length_583_cov_1.033058_1_plen_61_part_10